MKQIIKTILRLYDFKIILGFLGLFLICINKSIQFIPDVLGFTNIKSPESFLITLWTVTVGSSSVILSILLVVYSSFAKKIKRNSMDFILENPWIRIIFSVFAGSFIYISLAIASIKVIENASITLLYVSSIITVIYILIQFPLFALSLKYSNSLKRIRQLNRAITKNEINELSFPNRNLNDDNFVEQLERNNIVLLKDIGVHAIKEGDWGLPQEIINELYTTLIIPIDKNTKAEDIRVNLNAFCFVCNHFKVHAVSHCDFITTKVVLALLIRTHIHLAKNEMRSLRNNPIDNCIKDFHRMIIENSNFYNIQQYLIRDTINVIKAQFESINYSDDELPTLDYNIEIRKKGIQRNERSEKLRDFWFYIKQELPDLLFDDLVLAIEIGNKNVYENFNWQLHSLFNIVYNSKNLTEYQMNDVCSEYFYRAQKISKLAIKHRIYDRIDVVSNTQIGTWLQKDRKMALRSLRYFIDLIEELSIEQQLSEFYLDELFFYSKKPIRREDELKAKTSIYEIYY